MVILELIKLIQVEQDYMLLVQVLLPRKLLLSLKVLVVLMPEQKLDLLLLTLTLLMTQKVMHMLVLYEMVVEIHHLYSLKFLKEII